MAKKPADELHPDEKVVLDAIAAAEADPTGEGLEAAIRTSKALLTGLQHLYAERMQEALDGAGEPPSAMELVQLKKLEREIQNDEAYVEARRLTRRRSGTAAE